MAENLNGSLNGLLQDHGVELSNGSKTIGVCYATRDEARLLKIKENDALIISRDIAYDAENQPVYSSKEIINAERYEYKIMTNSMVKFI